MIKRSLLLLGADLVKLGGVPSWKSESQISHTNPELLIPNGGSEYKQ